MGTYTGTDGDDIIEQFGLSGGVVADPPGTTPGDGPDILFGMGGSDSLRGGEGNDLLDGDEGNDLLDGGGGRDELYGGDGDDHYLGGGNGSDEIFGGEGSDQLDGGRGKDRLFGGEGSDHLDGGSGADHMAGGSGDDRYKVNDLGDVVIEDTTDVSGGVDKVNADFSYTLGFGIEELTLRQGDLDGTGNALNNKLVGGKGDNVLKGLGGDDALNGRWGADKLFGGKGDDTLEGHKGEDRLSGGKGDDDFMFFSPSYAGHIITDFTETSGNDDRILITTASTSQAGFGGGLSGGGRLPRDQFQVSDNNQAQDADVRFIFRTTDQTLWFDRNGSKKDKFLLVLVADLQDDASLQANDIWLI